MVRRKSTREVGQLSNLAEDLLELAVRAWHVEHPDAPCGTGYASRNNELLALVERLYCAHHPHRCCDTADGCRTVGRWSSDTAWSEFVGPDLPEVADGDHVVYTAWDTDDVPDVRALYVGVTSHFAHRMEQHAARSIWWRFTTKITVDRFATREEADHIEADVIFGDAPPFNLAGIERR